MDRAGENILPTAVGSNDPPPSENSTLTIFLERISTLLKQRNFQDALEQCESALQIFGDHEKLQEKKIRILCHQGRFDESFEYAQKWVQRDPTNKLAQKELKRLRIVIQALRDQDSDDNEGGGNDSDDLIVESVSEEGNIKHDSHHQSPITTTLTRDTASPSSHKDDQDHCCTFCDIKFSSFTELETHCRSDLHKKRITSDEDQSWQFRIPPRNLTSEEFTLCRSYAENSKCNFGDKCTQAHSKEELNEWKERFKFRKQQIKIARDKHLHGNTYAEQLMEKLVNADNSKCIMTQNVEYAKIHVNSELKVNMTTKKCTNAWTFTITSKRSLHRVTLLDDTNRTYFYIASISVGPKKTQKYQNLETHCQEWVNPDYTTRHVGEYVYRVKVVFKTDIYGTFRQTLVYDFGLEPVLSREVQIESAPITDVEKLSKNLILNEQGRWRPENVQLIEYDSRPVPATEDEKHLLKKYCLPEAEKFRLGEHLMHPPSKETYRIWMHEMLYIEEWAQLEHISRFNVKTSLQLVNKFMLIPGALTGAKYAQTGELFAKMLLHDDLSEDSAGGRLILQSAHLAWLAPYNPEDKQDSKQVRKVYEVLLEDKGKNFIFFRLSNKCVEELNLSCDQEFHAEVQFQLNRLPKCEQHAAIDRLPTLDLVFPPSHPTESWFSEDVTFSEMVSTKLNKKQKDAIQGITAGRDLCLPPLLLIGPYGTGKTYTLAQAAVQALEDKDAKILICTHSNSAADIYIKDFIHPIVKEGHLEALPLRIYYRHRWVQTVPDVVLQYCLLEMSASQGNFRMPTREDVEKHRIIITTLSTARYLCDLDLPQGFFSHIFVDEAAQAMESETLIPLSLSGRTTKIVLCGDHMQLNPEVYSDFAKQQGFHKNLLDRLYEFYPDSCPCKIMLCENYRSHAAIIDFTSDLFYDSQLDSSGDQPLHPAYYPLTFFSTRGEDLQHQNSTGFYNIAEVHEVVDRVDDLQKNWPTEWGEIEGNIGVVAPYSDQVVRIRGELRKRKLFNVSVERVFNVQGKQFRAIILSTVRTRHTCSADSSQEDFVDYGFLSNVKLLNTALTRAQSLVIVVGDPLSLCLVGKCRKVWEYFLEICNDHKSLYGMKWSVLRAQLNSAELRKTYVLNPLAPEFVPNRLYHVTHNMGLPGSGSQSSQQQAGYFLGQRMMYPNNPYQHQQMYQPYMHMPYQGYYPPMMYRAYMPPFVGSRGNRVSSRVVYPRQMTPAVSLANSGRATPDKERASPDVVRSTESPQSVNVKKTHTTHSSQRGRPMVYIPRVQTPFQAMYYNPYHQPYPGYYILPEDPRLSAAAALHPHRYPYYPGTGLQPQHMLPHHYTGAPFMPATVIRPQYQPAAAEGGVVQGEGDTKRKVNSPTYSPAVSPGSTVTGQHIQLLPNARHIPVHLYNRAGTPNSSSRSSTPMGGRDSPDYSSEEGRRGVEPDYLKSISPKLDMQERRASAQSPLARVISQRQGYVAEEVLQVSQSRTQAVTSSMQYNASLIVSRESTSPIHNGERRDGGLSNRRKEGRKMPAKLDISTGFSRQFSEDIETPTEITNLVRMIDETIDEKAEFDARDDMSPVQNSFASRLSSKSSSGKLYLNIPKRASLDTSGGSASSSSPSASPTGSDDRKPTYAGVLRRRLPTSSEEIDASLLEPQTPHTPAGFVSPSDEIDTDPLGILRNLNINASTENQRTYKYFS